jgi:hypothetical protein
MTTVTTTDAGGRSALAIGRTAACLLHRRQHPARCYYHPPRVRLASGVVWLRALLITARTALVRPSQNAVEPADVSLGGRFLHQNMASLVRGPPGADHCAARERWRC